MTGGGSNPFTRYPCIAQAFPEGALSPGQYAPPPTDPTLDDFEYNLRIFNDGNVPMLEYVLYDILPRVSDTGSGGVLVNSARDSEFRPVLRGPIAVHPRTRRFDRDGLHHRVQLHDQPLPS